MLVGSLLAWLPLPAPAAAATSVSGQLAADAYVSSADPTRSYGSATELWADSSPASESYLRFNVGGDRDAITKAVLRLYVRDGTDNGPAVHSASNDWDESTVTWDTRPTRKDTVVADVGALGAGAWVEYDVTTVVQARGTYSFALAPQSGDGVKFTSGNSTSQSQRPQLVVTIDETAPATRMDAAPPSTSPSAGATFGFSSDDPAATFECSLDGAVFATCVSPTSYAELTDGAHRFQVRAKNAAGTTDPTPAVADWTVDTTAPAVTDTSPAAGATGVAPDRDVVLTFSEAMDGSTITADSVTLTDSRTTTQVAAAVSYDASSKKATLDPVADLEGGVTYAAGTTRAARDLAGNPVTDKQWTFTVAVPDTSPPTVGVVSPASDATDVSLTTNVTAKFSEDIDAATLSPATFRLAPVDAPDAPPGSDVAATVTYDPSTQTATLDPSGPLSEGLQYVAKVTTGVKDVAGNPLATDAAWSFSTVAPDTTPPTVVQMVPNAGATGAAISADVIATFSEPVDASTVTAQTVTLTAGGGSLIAATVTYDGSTKRAVVNPAVDLEYGTTYTATVGTGVTDTSGNPLATDEVWSFTTELQTLTLAPEADAYVASGSPDFAHGKATTLIADSSPAAESYLRFKVDGGKGAIRRAVLRLFVRDDTDDGPAIFAADNAWDEQTVTWKTKPTAGGTTVADHGPLLVGAWAEYDVTSLISTRGTYSVQLRPNSSNQVAFTSRESASTSTRPRLVVTLDPSVPSTTLNDTPPELSTQGAATFTFSSNDPSASFECALDGPSFRPCESPTDYAGLTEGSHAFQVRAVNSAGNADPSPATYTWTVDSSAPEVTSTAPQDGALGVAPGANVSAYFSETMKSATLDASTVHLTVAGGSTSIPATVAYDAELQRVTLNPDADLMPDTSYVATVSGGPTGAKDLAGNVLPADQTWSFVTAGEPKSAILGAAADATVQSGSPGTNYGSATSFKVDASPQTQSFLRFDVAGFQYGATSAKLRLYVTDATDNGPRIYSADNGWTETTVTWNTKPALAGQVSDIGALGTTGVWAEYDVSSLIKGNGTYSLGLVGDSSNSVSFSSREATPSRRPQLVVGYDPAAVSVAASPGGGSYSTRQRVELTASEPSTIWYTTDETDPSDTSSHTRHQYTGPLDIAVDTPLKFVAVTDDGPMSEVRTEIYTINATAGERDFYYGGTGVTEATADKTESKLWFHDGLWWGALYNNGAKEYRIYRFDGHGWTDTGTALDERENSRADVLSDGDKLYVATGTTVVSEFGNAPTAEEVAAGSGRLLRFSYDPASRSYTLDPGFPVTIRQGSSESMTFDKDSTGRLWITFTRDGQVWVNHSLGDDLTWADPFVPALGGVSAHPDDISSIISFGGDKVGLMWSNQVEKKFFFAVHRDGDPPRVWQPSEVAHGGGIAGCGTAANGGTGCANDHLNLKATSDGRILAGIKTANRTTGQPLVRLLVRGTGGTWSGHTFSGVEDEESRPRVLVDEANGWVYLLVTKPELGGAIFYKRTSLNDIAFAPGIGEPLIQSPNDPQVNNATSTKQNLSGGFLVLASDTATKYYLRARVG